VNGNAVRRVRVAAGVCFRDGEILLTRRPPGGEHGLLWEFPGGKIEPGETPEQALVREIREELGVDCEALAVLDRARHTYPSRLEVEIVFLGCRLASHQFTASEAVHEARWVRPQDVDPATILAADRPFLARLAGRG
jgi:8-oxo-dGTP diphosphatase